MLKQLTFVILMSFCVLNHAQSMPQMQLSVLDLVQLTIEELGEVEVRPSYKFVTKSGKVEIYSSDQLATNVAHFDIEQINQCTSSKTLLRELLYGRTSKGHDSPNISESWDHISLYIDGNLINSDTAEAKFTELLKNNQIKEIYSIRLYIKETFSNIKGCVHVITE